MKKKSPSLTLQLQELRIPVFVVGAGLVLLLCVGIVIGSIYVFSKKAKTAKNGNPSVKAQNEVQDLIKAVGALIELPPDETPTVATVSDKTKLQGQSFFSHAENGDKVLIYPKAKKAILYRPATKKIVEVAPLNINTPPSPTVSQTEPTTFLKATAPVSVSIYNGTKIPNLASNTEKKLTEEFSNITVLEKANAQNDYRKTIVVDVSGSNKDIATQIAKYLNGIVTTAPENETLPDAEILVIVGE